VREMASVGEVDYRRCRVATSVATDRRRVTGKQIEREAEGRRSRLPSMSGGHDDGQASAAWSSRSLQTSSGHGAIC